MSVTGLKPRCGQGWVLPEALGEARFQAPVCFSGLPGTLGHLEGVWMQP